MSVFKTETGFIAIENEHQAHGYTIAEAVINLIIMQNA